MYAVAAAVEAAQKVEPERLRREEREHDRGAAAAEQAVAERRAHAAVHAAVHAAAVETAHKKNSSLLAPRLCP